MRIVGRISDDCPADVWRRRRDLHDAVDFGLEAARICGFAQVRGFSVGSDESRRYALQRPQGVAHGGPVVVGPAVVVAEEPFMRLRRTCMAWQAMTEMKRWAAARPCFW